MIAHNFFDFDHNIGILYLKTIVLMRLIELTKNFLKEFLSYPVLTTTQNDEKWHIFKVEILKHTEVAHNKDSTN